MTTSFTKISEGPSRPPVNRQATPRGSPPTGCMRTAAADYDTDYKKPIVTDILSENFFITQKCTIKR